MRAVFVNWALPALAPRMQIEQTLGAEGGSLLQLAEPSFEQQWFLLKLSSSRKSYKTAHYGKP